MKLIIDYETFKSHIIDEKKKISRQDFMEKSNLNKLWDKLPKDDFRKLSFNHKKEKFVEFYYNYLVEGVDNFLRFFFEKRISCESVPDFNLVPLPFENDKIRVVSDGTRYFRSIFNHKMVESTNRYGFSIKGIIQNFYYDGKVLDCFFVPSVFKDIKLNDLTYIPDTMIVTFKTKASMVSIFSPRLYKSFLIRCSNHTKINPQNVLFSCADWGTPVVAAKDLGYSYLDIVDVMPEVLEGCYKIHSDIHQNLSFFNEDPYKLNTFCIPSEKMSSVLPRKYDIAFSCPPYFDMEIYETGGNQSTTLYPNYETWLKEYWENTVLETKKVLNKNGIMGYVMANIVENYNIGKDMKEIASKHLTFVEEIRMLTPKKNNMSEGEHRYESCFIFKK